MPKQKRVRRWRVRVCQAMVEVPTDYIIYAVDGLDARMLAYALDGGFPKSMTDMTDKGLELQRVSRYTRII